MIQRGNNGYILKTSSGVMKLGPTRKLRAGGRLDDDYFKELDMDIKKRPHLGIVGSYWNDGIRNTGGLPLKANTRLKGRAI